MTKGVHVDNEFGSDLEVPKGASAVAHTVVSFRGRERVVREDELAVEEPLEIRLAGRSLAVTMRTPGHDDDWSRASCSRSG